MAEEAPGCQQQPPPRLRLTPLPQAACHQGLAMTRGGGPQPPAEGQAEVPPLPWPWLPVEGPVIMRIPGGWGISPRNAARSWSRDQHASYSLLPSEGLGRAAGRPVAPWEPGFLHHRASSSLQSWQSSTCVLGQWAALSSLHLLHWKDMASAPPSWLVSKATQAQLRGALPHRRHGFKYIYIYIFFFFISKGCSYYQVYPY